MSTRDKNVAQDCLVNCGIYQLDAFLYLVHQLEFREERLYTGESFMGSMKCLQNVD